MGGVAATSLLARRPRPKPHTAAEKHPHRDAQGQSRTVPDAAMSLVVGSTHEVVVYGETFSLAYGDLWAI
jgi:hypothetical protein